jgi:hypothetical protein
VRVPSLPDVPTLDEQGLKGFALVVWNGLFAPKGTPKPALDRLVGALQTAVMDPAFKTRLADLGAEPVAVDKATPESLRTPLKSEIDKWGRSSGKRACTQTDPAFEKIEEAPASLRHHRRGYLAQVNAMKRVFATLAAAG